MEEEGVGFVGDDEEVLVADADLDVEGGALEGGGLVVGHVGHHGIPADFFFDDVEEVLLELVGLGGLAQHILLELIDFLQEVLGPLLGLG